MCLNNNSTQQVFGYFIAMIWIFISILTFMFVSNKKTYTEYLSQQVGLNNWVLISSVG